MILIFFFLQVMAHKMFRIINSIYEEMRMSSVTQNLASEASKHKIYFVLLFISFFIVFYNIFLLLLLYYIYYFIYFFAGKTEYVFHLLSIYDSFKKMSIILQFARDEINSTSLYLTQIQNLLEISNFEQLEQTRLFLGEVVQILASDAAEVI